MVGDINYKCDGVIDIITGGSGSTVYGRMVVRYPLSSAQLVLFVEFFTNCSSANNTVATKPRKVKSDCNKFKNAVCMEGECKCNGQCVPLTPAPKAFCIDDQTGISTDTGCTDDTPFCVADPERSGTRSAACINNQTGNSVDMACNDYWPFCDSDQGNVGFECGHCVNDQTGNNRDTGCTRVVITGHTVQPTKERLVLNVVAASTTRLITIEIHSCLQMQAEADAA